MCRILTCRLSLFVLICAAFLFACSCKRDTSVPPEVAGITSAYGTENNEAIQHLLSDANDGVLALGYIDLGGLPGLLSMRVDDGGYTPWGATSSLQFGQQTSRLSCFGFKRNDAGTPWAAVAYKTGFGIGPMATDGTIPQLFQIKIEPELIKSHPISRVSGGGFCKGPSGDFYLAGNTYDDRENDDALILRVNSSGQLLWAYSYDADNAREYFTDVVDTDDGSCMAVGFAITDNQNPELLLVSIGQDGQVRSSQRFASNYALTDAKIKRTPTGFAIVAQATLNIGPKQNIALLTTDGGGNIAQAQMIEAAGRLTPKSLIPVGDGWALTGNYEPESLDQGTDAFWIRTDASLNPNAAFHIGARGIETGNDLATTERGGFWLGGSAESFSPSSDFLLIRVNDRLESRCHQKSLVTQTNSLSLAPKPNTIVARQLNYWKSETIQMIVRTNISRNRPGSAQPCSN